MAAILTVYSRSWFFLRWYRFIYALPALYFLIDIIAFTLRTYNLSLLDLFVTVLTFVFGIILDLLVIITTFQYKNMFDESVSTWSLVRRYFWRACGISIASIFGVLILISPVCFLIFLVLVAELNGLLVLFLGVALIAFLIFHFGTYGLGLRILISSNKKIWESMWQGFRELNIHQASYLPFVIVSVFLSVSPFLFATVLSGTQFRLNSSLLELAKFVSSVERSIWSILFLFNYIITPLNIVATTLVYFDNNFALLPESENIKVST